ncbi:bifunctional diguanylate cyclase/phosphodiesterase [Ideonella sp. BN130291]|uniref:bifunctional diguanylate cyclase/phosphodiesterase n=1 Tax=Ideonella sp. BN130291 TaxID=3112940 RepID=UPI002E275AB3|nr:diguanylate cyclase [Ideonella sp. BN130291]
MPFTNLFAPKDRGRQAQRRFALGVILVNVAVAGLLALLVYLVLAASRRAYETQARDTAEGLAAVAQLNVASELSRVDNLLRAALGELDAGRQAGRLDDDTVNRILARHRELLPGVEGLRLADAQGRVRWGNDLPAGAPVDISDRDYFAQARQRADGAAVIGGPVKSRVSGNWVVALVHAVRWEGRFDGVLFATLAVDHFQRLFARYHLVERDAITLRTSDLRLVARHAPGSTAALSIGSTSVSAELRAAMARNISHGAFVSRNLPDGVERTAAFRQVDGWPFVVITGLGNERFFAPWRAQARQVALLALVAWLLTAVATYSVYLSWLRQSHSMRALAAQTRRVQTLLRVASDGIHILDHTGRLVAMSDSFAQMLGSTSQQLLGRHVSSWDANQGEARISAWLATIRNGDRQLVEVQHRRDDGRILDVELALSVVDIDGELMVFGSARDVTERKRLLASLEASSAQARQLLAEQTAMLNNDIVGMAKLRDRTALWTNRALERMFGYAAGELQGRSSRLLYPSDAAFEALGREAYAALAAGQNYRTQLQLQHKEGHLLWIDLSGVALSDGLSFWMMVDITAMKEAQARIEHIAFHDALTQLPNRLLLADRLHQAIAAAVRAGTRTAVCYLDLDGFKQVNDMHGHEAGDALLAELASRLQAALRGNDTAARVGGDEFVLLITGLEQTGGWRPIVQRLMELLHAPVVLPGGLLVRVGASMGVALVPDDGTDPSALLAKADEAMLHAKRAGKGRIVLAAGG